MGDVRKLDPEPARPSTRASPARCTRGAHPLRRPAAGALRGGAVPAGRASRGPRSLLQIHPGVDPTAAKDTSRDAACARSETAEKITAHLSRVLDLILFSGHRAYLTSNMHLASVRANFRELAEKKPTPAAGLRQAQGARPPQVELPGDHEPRAAHAADLDHRLLRDAGERHRRQLNTSTMSSSRPSATRATTCSS